MSRYWSTSFSSLPICIAESFFRGLLFSSFLYTVYVIFSLSLWESNPERYWVTVTPTGFNGIYRCSAPCRIWPYIYLYFHQHHCLFFLAKGKAIALNNLWRSFPTVYINCKISLPPLYCKGNCLWAVCIFQPTKPLISGIETRLREGKSYLKRGKLGL